MPERAESDLNPGPTTWCIVVAGGSGQRFGAPKQFCDLAGRTVLARSVDTAVGCCDGVVVVLPADRDPVQVPALPASVQVVDGGPSRSASVRAGLAAVPEHVDAVLVHDAARPLASTRLFARVIGALADADAAVPVVAVTDTICTDVGEPVDRDRLRAVQTPQGFRAEALRSVHADEPDATDDAGLIAADGGAVALVDGETTNLKITTPNDLTVASALLSAADSVS